MRRLAQVVTGRIGTFSEEPDLPPVIEKPIAAEPKSEPWKRKGPSPYDRFRSYRGFLAVTDLVSPSWCEVQYDYALRQKRHLKLQDRPTSFKTADGKLISVDKNVAAVNNTAAQRGRSVHKVLEREIHPEPVAVDLVTGEDRWGLRLVNMITSLQTLLDGGRCREMPVFGILNGQIITGIIDEIERKPISPPEPLSPRSRNKRSTPSTPTKGKLKKSRLSPSFPEQPSITSFFPSTPKRSADYPIDEDFAGPSSEAMSSLPRPPPQFRLHISDTKTRRHHSVPPIEDTLTARLQLMFYHRLLSRLLLPPSQSADSLDFQTLWLLLQLNHRRKFSPNFRKQLGLGADTAANSNFLGTAEGGLSTATCLDDLTRIWRNTVETLSLGGVDDMLTIVYRTQPVVQRKKRKGKSTKRKPGTVSKDEEENIIRAVIDSLKDGPSLDDPELAEAISESWRKISTDVDVNRGVVPLDDAEVIEAEASRACAETANQADQGAQLAWAIQQSLLAHVRERPELKQSIMPLSRSSSPSPSPPTSKDGETEGVQTEPEGSDSDIDVDQQIASTVIGTKKFRMDDRMLNGYLGSVLDWWHGRRPPKGVDLELTRRCLWCEYQEGCEWREKKATEAREKIRSQLI
ncbi:unnamed protein product [Somion occarium]|uniref:Exonuclease V n=1 Tax=Somion occarium TaxID=3059160 RepID=A0ABP1CJ35_9APHY